MATRIGNRNWATNNPIRPASKYRFKGRQVLTDLIWELLLNVINKCDSHLEHIGGEEGEEDNDEGKNQTDVLNPVKENSQ